jgi:hypothetical protein
MESKLLRAVVEYIGRKALKLSSHSKPEEFIGNLNVAGHVSTILGYFDNEVSENCVIKYT